MPSSGFPDELCQRFSLAEIKRATNNFDNDLVIAEGAFGRVYKGHININDGSNKATTVSIKRRSKNSMQGQPEFRTEVQLCCQLRHPNLVAFKGFCDDGDEMILVSEYMANGSLDRHLFRRSNRSIIKEALPWKRRLQICIEVARGLHYLHCGAKYAIIHRDVNSSSILLDENWVAKVSDFGLSKMGPSSMSKALIRMDSRVMGTSGYAEPEYAATGELTEKSDVYLFGVLLFEVLSGRRAIDTNLQIHNLIEWVSKELKDGKVDWIMDPNLVGKIAPECLKSFLEIAERCVFRERIERPAMGEVEVILESALELQDIADSSHSATATREGISTGYVHPAMSLESALEPQEIADSHSPTATATREGISSTGHVHPPHHHNNSNAPPRHNNHKVRCSCFSFMAFT